MIAAAGLPRCSTGRLSLMISRGRRPLNNAVDTRNYRQFPHLPFFFSPDETKLQPYRPEMLAIVPMPFVRAAGMKNKASTEIPRHKKKTLSIREIR